MKINFSKIYSYQPTKKSDKPNTTLQKKQNFVSLNGLNCIASYNLAFGKRAVYAIKYDGSYQKFESVKDACNAFGISNINNTLNGITSASNGAVFAYADTLEEKDGTINPQALKKLLSGFEVASNQPIYMIDIHGTIHRFDKPTQAIEELHISQSQISELLNKNKGTVKGYVAIRAFDVDLRNESGALLKDKNGQQMIDRKKINKLRENFLYAKNFPIAKIDSKGNIKQYANTEKAALDTNRKKRDIYSSLNTGRIISESFFFVRLSDIVARDANKDVVFDENNNFVIDDNKIQEFVKSRFRK